MSSPSHHKHARVASRAAVRQSYDFTEILGHNALAIEQNIEKDIQDAAERRPSLLVVDTANGKGGGGPPKGGGVPGIPPPRGSRFRRLLSSISSVISADG